MIGLFGVGLVETLGTHLEAQVLHQFEDMVLAFEDEDVLIADGVVALLVVEVHQGGDLRETVSDVLEQGLGLLFALGKCLCRTPVVVELDDHKPLARGRVADDDVAQEARLGAEVEERQTVGDGVVADLVADLVVQVVHQPALLDGQDLVEGAGDVEADGGHVLQAANAIVQTTPVPS